MEKERQDAVITSASSSSSTQFLSSWDSSSSSGFSSSEADDADFIAELTRQMAECMLDEEEDANVYEASSDENSGAISSLKSELYSSADDPTQPNIQVKS